MNKHVYFEVKNHVGLITLNRPGKLNALNHDMCSLIDHQLVQWENNDAVKVVIIRGEGDRAFCAGGDVAGIYHNGPNNIEKSMEFFTTEYAMNKRIFHFPKPYVALLHGITMGGGLGVSVHGSPTIADPNVVMAMPETGIGFFPDVGGGYFLSRSPGEVGTYLGLTGARFTADDASYCGLVDYHVPKEKFDELTQAIIEKEQNLVSIVEKFSVPIGISQLEKQSEMINVCFCYDDIEKIFEVLSNQKNDFAEIALATLAKKSPTSLCLTLKQLRDAKNLGFDECMAMEHRMVREVLQQHDFYEGVRAVVIDKDYQPNWQV